MNLSGAVRLSQQNLIGWKRLTFTAWAFKVCECFLFGFDVYPSFIFSVKGVVFLSIHYNHDKGGYYTRFNYPFTSETNNLRCIFSKSLSIMQSSIGSNFHPYLSPSIHPSINPFSFSYCWADPGGSRLIKVVQASLIVFQLPLGPKASSGQMRSEIPPASPGSNLPGGSRSDVEQT